MPVAPAAPPTAPTVDHDPFAALAAPESELAFSPSSGMAGARPSVRRRKKRGLSLLVVGLSLVIGLPVVFVGLAVGAYMVLSAFSDIDEPIPDAPSAGNFVFHAPRRPWKTDATTQKNMAVDYAMKRGGPDNNLGILFRDYKTRSPSDAEMREEALKHLKGCIAQGLETEIKPSNDQKTLGGRTALVLEFAGNDANNVPVMGECLMLTYQGYAYWFFTWGPQTENDKVAPEWDTVRQGFVLGNNRSGWKESQRDSFEVRGVKVPYHLNPVKGLWKKEPLDKPEVREQYGEKADVVMTGTYPGDPKATVKAKSSAVAQVAVLDRAEDLPKALLAARAFLLEMEKDKREGSYTYPDTTMDLVQDTSIKNIDDTFVTAKAKVRVQKLAVENDKNRLRYVVLGVVQRNEGVVVVWLECDNSYRDFWELEFTALLKTLQF